MTETPSGDRAGDYGTAAHTSFGTSAGTRATRPPAAESGTGGADALVSRRGAELTPAELYALLRLRVDVFVVEQHCPYPELDGRDLAEGTRHLWLVAEDGAAGPAPRDPATAGHEGAVAGCLRILTEPDGTLRIGRVCTAARSRGTGVGDRLMRAAMELVGETDSVLDAQTYAVGFYARYGYVRVGDEFLEDGIPHVTMRRTRS